MKLLLGDIYLDEVKDMALYPLMRPARDSEGKYRPRRLRWILFQPASCREARLCLLTCDSTLDRRQKRRLRRQAKIG